MSNASSLDHVELSHPQDDCNTLHHIKFVTCLDVMQQKKQELASDNKKLKKNMLQGESTAVAASDSIPVVVGTSDTFEDLYSCSSSSEDDDEE